MTYFLEVLTVKLLRFRSWKKCVLEIEFLPFDQKNGAVIVVEIREISNISKPSPFFENVVALEDLCIKLIGQLAVLFCIEVFLRAVHR